MPLFEYVLLALLGSGGITPSPTLGPESIAQPNGGTMIVSQETPKKDDSRRTRYRRRHKRHTPQTPKKDGGSH